MKAPRATVITAEHPERGTLYAAIDPAARHVTPCVAERRFPAFCSPFPSEDAARAALLAEGCKEVAHG